MSNPQAVSRVYLALVPFLAAGIALGLGHSNPQLYLPIWLTHALLMAFAVWSCMGPPPISIPDWVATVTEQQIRYALLIAGEFQSRLDSPYWPTNFDNVGKRRTAYLAYWL